MCSAHRLTERNILVKLMKIVQRVQEIWSEHESVRDGMTEGQTDWETKGIPIIPHLLHRRGLRKCLLSFKTWNGQSYLSVWENTTECKGLNVCRGRRFILIPRPHAPCPPVVELQVNRNTLIDTDETATVDLSLLWGSWELVANRIKMCGYPRAGVA